MSWAEAKWITDKFTFVPGQIEPGDEKLTTVLSGTYTQNGNQTNVIGSFVVPDGVSGKVRFKATLKSSYANYKALWAITSNNTRFLYGQQDTQSQVIGYVETNATSNTTVYIDVKVVPGQTLYMQICNSSTGTTTISNITMGYDSPTVVSAKTPSPVKSIQQGYYVAATPYNQDSECGSIYYQSITLKYPVSSNSIALFWPKGSSAITSNAWWGTGFARVVNSTELRLYTPYSSNSSFGGYWIVIDLDTEG